MSFIVYDLIFLYTYFVKIFCQKFVKKNCKLSFPVFLGNADVKGKGNIENVYLTGRKGVIYHLRP